MLRVSEAVSADQFGLPGELRVRWGIGWLCQFNCFAMTGVVKRPKWGGLVDQLHKILYLIHMHCYNQACTGKVNIITSKVHDNVESDGIQIVYLSFHSGNCAHMLMHTSGQERLHKKEGKGSWYILVVNPQHVCAARATVLGHCVCDTTVCVCLSVYGYSGTTGYRVAYEWYQQLQNNESKKNKKTIFTETTSFWWYIMKMS